ncbi:MAG: MFS transporter [Sedimentisphaerales bacterium]|nr:MFS transporter [Sedimentisphaerales bacterium]
MENRPISYPSYRWVILLLVFLATTINYADRIVLGVTANEIRETLSLDDVQYGYVLTAFSVLYAVGFLIAGKVIDMLGTKLGYLLSLVTWSLAGAFTGLSHSLMSLAFWRGALGLTQSGNFPAAIKAVAEWFHIRQRSLATALFNSGPSIALVIGPPIIGELTVGVGWRNTFIIIGLAGLPLALFWQLLYKHPKHLNNVAAEENANRRPSEKVRWRDIIKEKRTWGIMIGKFCTDPVWWFYVFWLAPFLKKEYEFNIRQIAWSMAIIYAISIVLANLAAWYTGRLIGKGWNEFKARKWIMFLCAMCLPITALSAFVDSPVIVILLVSLAAGAHSGWSANIFTLVTDCFPSRSVASATGLAGFAGGVGGIFISSLASGFIIANLDYAPIFIVMGLLHPFAILCVHFMVQKK